MKNTVQPDRLYLNLSKTEFDGIELPQDLVDYFNSDERLIGDKKTYLKLIKSLSTKYRVLVSDANKLTLYFGDLNDFNNC